MIDFPGTVDISFKDQELETAFAKQLGVPLLLANVSQQVYQMARAAGFNKEDGTAVIKVLERLAGVQVGGPQPRCEEDGLPREGSNACSGAGHRRETVRFTLTEATTIAREGKP